MRPARMPVTLRRMGAHWPVFGAVLVTVFVSATLAAAFAVFAGQAVPQAVHRELAVAPGTSVLISGSVVESQLAPDTRAVHADILVSGQWPAKPQNGQPIPAVLSVAAATLLHLTVGDVLTLRAPNTGKPVPVRLTGEFRPRHPAAEYWRLDLVGVSGVKTVTTVTTVKTVKGRHPVHHLRPAGRGSGSARHGLPCRDR